MSLSFLINCRQNNIDDSFVLLSNSYAPFIYLPCKSYVTPIFLLFWGTDLKRTWNGGTTDLQRRQKDVIIGFQDWCNTLKMKNQKVFREGITPFAVISNTFVDYQCVRCDVIPLKVLHHFGRFDVILV